MTRNSLSLLIVDDERISQIILKKLSENIGHGAAAVSTGAAALEAMREQHFDAVLLDVELPDTTGPELVARIRSGEAGDGHRQVRIIAVTGHAMEGDRENLLAAGMDDYLSKPVSAHDLDELFRRDG
jgi:two-component system CheB/CheR fusion protein